MDCFSDFYERLEALTELPEPLEDEDGEPVEEEEQFATKNTIQWKKKNS